VAHHTVGTTDSVDVPRLVDCSCTVRGTRQGMVTDLLLGEHNHTLSLCTMCAALALSSLCSLGVTLLVHMNGA